MLGSPMKQRAWTLDQRLQQAQRIRQQKPWEYSTGPKTPEGKAVSQKNSLKHGGRCKEIRDMQHQLAEWNRELKKLISYAG